MGDNERDVSDPENGQSRRTFMKATGTATAATTIGVGRGSTGKEGRSIDKLTDEMSVAEKAGQMLQPNIASLDRKSDFGNAPPETVGDLFAELGAGSVLSGGSSPPTLDPEELVARINDLHSTISRTRCTVSRFSMGSTGSTEPPMSTGLRPSRSDST